MTHCALLMRAGILHFVTAKLITMVGSFAKCKARCKIISVLEPLWIRLFLLTLSVFVLCTNSLSNVKLDSKKSLSAIVQRKESQGFLSNVHHSTKEIHSSKRSSRRDVLATVAAASLTLVIAEPSRAQELNEWAAGSDLPTETLAGVTSTIEEAPVDWNAIYQKASKKALGGGKAGASAAVVQVLSLMWLRTSMNRQYRYGGDLQSSLKALWEEGGIGRLYQGLPFALIQGPLTRFGDTAANVGILALLESAPETQALPLPIKTAIGSISAGTWRILLMPIDSSKTAMQGTW